MNRPSQLVGLSILLVSLTGVVSVGADSDRGTTVLLGEPVECSEDASDLVSRDYGPGGAVAHELAEPAM